MYWSASSWIWLSISRSDKVAGIEISLVITAEPDTATAARLLRVPALRTTLRTALPTASTSAMFFSTTAVEGKGSTA